MSTLKPLEKLDILKEAFSVFMKELKLLVNLIVDYKYFSEIVK